MERCNRPHWLAMVVLITMMSITTGNAMAQDSALKTYQDRVLAALDAHINAIGDIVDGRVPFQHHIADHAVAVVGSSRGLLETFPEKAGRKSKANGGDESSTDKKPTSFAVAAVKLNEHAALLVQLVTRSGPDPIKRQYGVLKEAYENLLSEVK